MTAYLTREAAEALRKALTVGWGTSHSAWERACHALDSIPVVDEVPAEEALGRLASRERTVAYDDSVQRCDDEAAVRHALRAAQAQADAPPDVIRRGHEWVAKIAETVERTRTCKGADHPEVAEILDAIEAGIPDARAAMHKLPKEE